MVFRPPPPPVPVERQEIELDVDVLFGAVPSRDVDASLEAVTGELTKHGIRRGLACPLRGVLFDACSGNDEMLKATAQTTNPQVGTVDIRDALTAEHEIGRLAAAGVKVLRLFPVEQWVEPDSPGLGVPLDHQLIRTSVPGERRAVPQAARRPGTRYTGVGLINRGAQWWGEPSTGGRPPWARTSRSTSSRARTALGIARRCAVASTCSPGCCVRRDSSSKGR